MTIVVTSQVTERLDPTEFARGIKGKMEIFGMVARFTIGHGQYIYPHAAYP